MTHEETTALVRRANASGFDTVADYAVSLETALKAVEWGYGEGCPDCGATDPETDNHRMCCLVARSLYGSLKEAA